ncbi:hypothetical protein G9A89_004401 [Geosiphon pyriformis]|nr:hypothetical protein G9A89_004401 [Geosiphon pyriformis]
MRKQGLFGPPIERELKQGIRVLDVGCGPSGWVLEMATTYTESEFIGIDYIPLFPSEIKPSNTSFIQTNVLNGLPFEEQWETIVIPELIRVTKIGGWIEIEQPEIILMNPPPDLANILEKFWHLETLGIDSNFASEKCENLLIATKKLTEITHKITKLSHKDRVGRAGEISKDNAILYYRTMAPIVMAPGNCRNFKTNCQTCNKLRRERVAVPMSDENRNQNDLQSGIKRKIIDERDSIACISRVQRKFQRLSHACDEISSGFWHIYHAMQDMEDISASNFQGLLREYLNESGNVLTSSENITDIKPKYLPLSMSPTGVTVQNEPLKNQKEMQNNMEELSSLQEKTSVAKLKNYLIHGLVLDHSSGPKLTSDKKFVVQGLLNSIKSEARIHQNRTRPQAPQTRSPAMSKSLKETTFNPARMSQKAPRKSKPLKVDQPPSSEIQNTKFKSVEMTSHSAIKNSTSPDQIKNDKWLEESARFMIEQFVLYYQRRHRTAIKPELLQKEVADEVLDLCKRRPTIDDFEDEFESYISGKIIPRDPTLLSAMEEWVLSEVIKRGQM